MTTTQQVIIIPTRSHDRCTPDTCTDIPAGYVIGYIVIALAVWAITTAITARKGPDGTAFEAVLQGAFAGLLWPLAILALPFWAIANIARRNK